MTSLVKEYGLSGGTGYADLMLAWHRGGEAELRALMALLGYGPALREPVNPPPVEVEPVKPSIQEEVFTLPPPDPFISYWRPVHYAARVPITVPATQTKYQHTLPAKPPSGRDLCRWSALVPRLRARFTERVPSRELDIQALIRLMASGRGFLRPPRKSYLRWGSSVQIIVDRSERLIPFQEDQERVARSLAALFPRYAVGFCLAFEGMSNPVSLGPQGEFQTYRLPSSGALVVMLGDLGCLAGDGQRQARRWGAFGARLAQAGCRLVALTPAPASRWLTGPLRVWRMVEWERRTAGLRLTQIELEERVERLLRLVSPAVRIEPGLLRDLRLLLGGGADAGTEADFWRHRALVGRSRVAATLDVEVAKRLREAFEREEPMELQLKVVERIHPWRGGLAPEVWYEELLNLSPELREQLPASIRENDLPAARQRFEQMADHPTRLQLEWYRRVDRRATPAYRLHDPALRKAQQKLELAAFSDEPDHVFSPGFDPALLPRFFNESVRFDLWQQGGRMVAGSGVSRLGHVESFNGFLRVGAPAMDSGFWKSGTPPDWATGWGRDGFGAWVTFEYGGVTQRMRWIPSGRFVMGSPAGEKGRNADEGPQHAVTISQGYWLFDTPCTQALWQAVMGETPSSFKDIPDRPVEQVSWQDVQQFVSRLNENRPGLELGLPSEAQWEYACRAGTTGATYAPDLDTIAWHDGNSDGQAHPVALKAPNSWGLFDMLGNVFEWCRDGLRQYEPEALIDPLGPMESGVWRVLRGGSWSFPARDARAAVRGHGAPVVRNRLLGFRCSRVPVSQASQAGAEPADPSSLSQAERRRVTGLAGEAGLVLAGGRQKTDCLLPRRDLFQVESDSERLTFDRITKPHWADAMGRDRVGLWATIVVTPAQGKPVTQRLRWIPPGRFLMGSPDGEQGRDDDEGPQHEVTISQGYWLFDTPCTQALWLAVMGENPSYFKNLLDHPVEQVSWEDVQVFLTRINDQIPDLQLALPSEAQWEYACRAGIATMIDGPELDAIAWHDGNSGATTHPVASKLPNGWGLYDMLGNVFEWCLDGRREYDSVAQIDPQGPMEFGVKRVVRGGSWLLPARVARAAYRYRDAPVVRSLNLGFRCSRAHT